MSFSTDNKNDEDKNKDKNKDKNDDDDDDDEMKATREAKKALRRSLRRQLQSLSLQEIQQESMAVWQQVWELPEYQEASSVALFVSMPTGEIQTRLALEHVLRHKDKQLYVPRVGLEFEAGDMEMVRVSASTASVVSDRPFYEDWPRNKWNIPEPPLDDEQEEVVAQPGHVDLVLVPGLAFDDKGGRLGQGKGYYDRFLEKMSRGEKKPILVAVGLQVSLVPHVPTTPWDYRMDIVVVPSQTIRVAPE